MTATQPETDEVRTKLEEAELVATLAHGNQRYGEYPYVWHLGAVERVLRRFGVTDIEMLQAAWLHDVLEDTYLTGDDLLETFSDRVVELVRAVTNVVPRDPRATAVKTASYPGALQLKLADRIANMEATGGTGKHYDRYRMAYRTWRYWMYDGFNPVLAPMWKHLDNLLA